MTDQPTSKLTKQRTKVLYGTVNLITSFQFYCLAFSFHFHHVVYQVLPRTELVVLDDDHDPFSERQFEVNAVDTDGHVDGNLIFIALYVYFIQINLLTSTLFPL